MTAALPIQWRPRTRPLEPCAVVALGDVVGSLGLRLLARSDEALSKLEAVALDDGLVVLGAANDLPWAQGVIYLGRDPAAPALLLPTNIEPPAHPALLERAILTRDNKLATPLGVMAFPALVFSASAARFLTRAALTDWLGRKT